MMGFKKSHCVGFAILFMACNQHPSTTLVNTEKNSKIMYATDPHSYAQPNQAVVKHLDLTLKVDFDKNTLSGKASWVIEHTGKEDTIIFDTKNLTITAVTLQTDKTETPTEYRLGNYDSILGAPLLVHVPQAITTITIYYSTNTDAAALQWLTPQQTAGKKYPFLFTQSQAILARTWIPCQDGPGIRFTYDAHIEVPSQYLALMSATNPQQKNNSGKYDFKQINPIPSYLMALAVGDIAFKNIGRNTGVYAEENMIDKCFNEFEDMQKMMDAAENLYGKYRWGRYDVIVLPPSFPFGGMENPELTFATPTIIAGDKSLVNLVAHEMAHSWSGNLVTNATWNDFWLNEGFTVYFENRIMEAVYGKDYEDMLEVLGYDDVIATIQDIGDTSADTHLKLKLEHRDPDDGMNDIAYEKGNLFLKLLEQTVGRDSFDVFVNKWFNQNAFQSRSTEQFIDFLNTNLITPNKDKFASIQINDWIYGPGLPANAPQVESQRFDKVDAEVVRFNTNTPAQQLKTQQWSTHEWLRFIHQLQANISIEKMKELDNAFHFTGTGNCEIADAWYELALQRNYSDAYSAVDTFLCSVGRRKFLTPLYKAMVNTNKKDMAKEIYAKARPGYHSVAQGTMDELLK